MSKFLYFVSFRILMRKRGQVGTYVIIGLVLVVLLVGGYFLRGAIVEKRLSPEEIALQKEAIDVKLIVENCFDKAVKNGLLILGLQGGHLRYPEPGYDLTRGLVVGYGYYLGENLLPSKKEIISAMNGYIPFEMQRCADFSDIGFEVEPGTASSRFNINDDSVYAALSWPIKVSKSEVEIVFSDVYEENYNVRLGRLLVIANEIVSMEIEDPSVIELSYLDSIGMNVTVFTIDENVNLYSIVDEASAIENSFYLFQFTNKFR